MRADVDAREADREREEVERGRRPRHGYGDHRRAREASRRVTGRNRAVVQHVHERVRDVRPVDAGRSLQSRGEALGGEICDCNEPEHIHVQRENKVCKYWLTPLALARNDGFSGRELNQIRAQIALNLETILEAWNEHCG